MDSTFVIESQMLAELCLQDLQSPVMIGLLGFLVISGKKPRDDDFEDSEFA